MLEPNPTPCLIYCRVSSAKQMSEGDGLNSQEKRCQDYAIMKGYAVIGTFQEGITGATADRPAMNAMLNALQAQTQETVIIIDDIKRFARDVSLHFDLKSEITRRGGRLESPLFRFEDSPEGKFVETVIAAQAELERNQNQRQVMNRMRARMEQGYWVFKPSPGYRYVHERTHKKVLALDEKWAPLVKEALEGFARERFASVMDVFRFLDNSGLFGVVKSRNRSRHIMTVHRILRQRLYTGYVEFEPWGVALRKGYHPSLISLETYEQIQEKLDGRRRPTLVSSHREEFILRNFVACARCGRAYTGYWSKGKYQRYAYYHCFNKDCSEYAKGIPRAKMEGEFEERLRAMQTTEATMVYMERRALGIWRDRQAARDVAMQRLEARLREIERELAETLDKYRQTQSAVVGRMLEERAEELDSERLHLVDKLAHSKEGDLAPNEEAFRTLFASVREVLKNPYETWEYAGAPLKRTVLKLAFSGSLLYDRQMGFRTPNYSLPYQILHGRTTEVSVWWTKRDKFRTLSPDTDNMENETQLFSMLQQFGDALQEAMFAT